jgi:hypothetical protein
MSTRQQPRTTWFMSVLLPELCGPMMATTW